MAFVPEGQADSSQARSAWVADAERPCPGGTVEVIVSPLSVPEIFVVETGAHAALRNAKGIHPAGAQPQKPRSVQSSRWDGRPPDRPDSDMHPPTASAARTPLPLDRF